MVLRHDVVTLDAQTMTPEGYIDTTGTLTRVGVFKYTREDGTEQLELRLPEHVFDEHSLQSFDGQPLTLGHPSDSISADTWRANAVGVVMSPKADGDNMRARIRIMDADAVRAVRAGIKELSNGYVTDLVAIPNGEFQREDLFEGKAIRADFLQTRIIGNHTALVAKGRAGPTARLDSVGNQEQEKDMTITKEQFDALQKKTDEQAALIATLTKQIAEQSAKVAEPKADEVAQLRTQLAEQVAANKIMQNERRVSAHKQLADQAAPLAGKKADELLVLGTDETREDEILRAAIVKALPGVDVKGWDTASLRGAFNAALSVEKNRQDSASLAANAAAGTRKDEVVFDGAPALQAARQMQQRFRDAWKSSRK